MKARNTSALALAVVLLLLTAASALSRAPQPAASTSSAAAAPWYIETVDPALGVGSHTSVAINASGTTYISYYDASTLDLKVAKYVGSGGNCDVNGNWFCETVDASGDVGQYSSIAIDPTTGLPVVAYWKMDNPYALKLATAWSGGWDITTITSIAGSHTSVKVDAAGSPHIAYYGYYGDNNLMYARRVGGGTGTCGGGNFQCEIIDSGAGVGYFPSLALDTTGQPRIAYYGGGNGGLWYAQPDPLGNCGQGNTWGCYPILASESAGRNASLALDSGNLSHVASYDISNGKLLYAVQVESGGNCGPLGSWQCDHIADMGDATYPRTRDVALAVDNAGLPIIAYSWYYGTPYSTRGFSWIRPAAALGLTVGNCGPGDLWQCGAIDGSFAGDYAAIALHSSGLATVAYNYTQYPGALRVAYQRFRVFLPVAAKGQ